MRLRKEGVAIFLRVKKSHCRAPKGFLKFGFGYTMDDYFSLGGENQLSLLKQIGL
jgi:hypothetical protein